LRHLTHRLGAHRIEQGIAVLEVAIRGVRDDTHLAGSFPQHDRVGSARARASALPASIRPRRT